MDDAPAGGALEVGHGQLGGHESGAQVHRHDAVELLQGELLRVGDGGDTGVVDHDVEAAELAHGALHQRLELTFVGNVGGGEQRAPSQLRDDGRRGWLRLGLMVDADLGILADIGHRHRRAFARQLQGNAAADARAGAGDDGDPVLQTHDPIVRHLPAAGALPPYWPGTISDSLSTTSWAPPSRRLVAETTVRRASRCSAARSVTPQLHMVLLILVSVWLRLSRSSPA